ncbi:putative transcription factor WD40-like family [Helianthus debilis subsp. tardiflorus]
MTYIKDELLPRFFSRLTPCEAKGNALKLVSVLLNLGLLVVLITHWCLHQDGSILAWKYNAASNCFEPAASLQGHTSAVVTLVVGANRLYSGSMDKSIRVWNLENLQCLQTLTDHRDVVMSVLCWDQFLLSCSLDKTIKVLAHHFLIYEEVFFLVYKCLFCLLMQVWAATESGNLEVTYTHNEDHVC